MRIPESGTPKICRTRLGVGFAAAIMVFSCQDPASSRPSSVNKSAEPVTFSLQATSQAGWRQQMIAQAVQFKGLITTRFPELQGQRDRQGKLTAELMNKSTSGCFSDAKLAKLEILIQGSWLPRKGMGNTPNPMSALSSGNPSTVTFQLGDSLAVVNDEQTSGMFQPAGRKVVTDFQESKLGDIEYIRIAKGGAGYDSERVCKRSGFLGTGEKCEYQNYEEGRLELNSVEMKANGETFYKRGGIGKQFEGGNLEWRDDQLHINEAWLKLMVRTDCVQGQGQ
jgi:hypothetical protein